MNIYEKIDVIFSGEAEDKPQWADEILTQLQEIKILLQEQKQHPQSSQKISRNFYAFIKEFRISMRANTTEKIYPTFIYDNKRLGVDFKGLLYDKESSKLLSKDEAYKVYKYAYSHQNNTKYSA
ncbi:MAG: hypothetical protein U9R50_07095 [Campylobacterota bacterium]|nr:hypothetical protein [Campylobacterota bacterium]